MAVNENSETLGAASSMTRRGALLTGVTLGGLTFASALAPPAQAAAFKDIARSPFKKDIEWMSKTGLANGWSDKTFRPMEPIKRDAMAAFLHRFAGAPSTKYIPSFTDVGPNTLFAKEMSWMKAQGISWGWVNGKYQPLAPIKRDAMAAFMYRLLDQRLRQHGVKINVGSVAQFRDVKSSRLFSHEMRWMKASGISTGWNDGTFRPNAPVLRHDMAAFLHRAAALAERAR